MIRLEVRRSSPGARVEKTEDGFIVTGVDRPTACNIRSLYLEYCKKPADRDALVHHWMTTLRTHLTEVGDQPWSEARATLRPTLKNHRYIEQARASMAKATPPDSLPGSEFVGDLYVIAMREVSGSMTAVTQNQIDGWGLTINEVMEEALNNMSLMSFPPVSRSLLAGNSASRVGGQQEVGLVFEGDHLMATWLVLERFRDFLWQRLEGDYVASVPNRNRLVAVRADESGLIASILQSNRNLEKMPYPLSSQLFLVSGATTGGVVSVYSPSATPGATLDSSSIFAAGGKATSLPNLAQPSVGGAAYKRPELVDFGAWDGLTEPTSTAGSATQPAASTRGKK
ncbi:MAG TPA: hypothetical protein VGS41_06240 [Chthonomonadales bacterium]|nr:hypothetical protein [Chthonomonadales bacterium]